MELEAIYSNGSKVIYHVENNLLNTMIVILRKNILHMECLRDPYSDPFYLYYTSMIFLKRLTYLFTILFADDKSVFIEGTSYNNIINDMNRELEKVDSGLNPTN